MRVDKRFGFGLIIALLVFHCFNRATLAAELGPSFRLGSTKAIRLLGANCFPHLCFVSAAFAPGITSDRVTAVVVTNDGNQTLSIMPTMIATNGPAIAARAVLAPLETLRLEPGETRSLKIAVVDDGLSAGNYTGDLTFSAPGAAKVVVPVEIRIRASAVWAILATLAGIVLGRLSQLVYDPKTVARLRLYDWLYELEGAIERTGGGKEEFRRRLAALREQILARNADADALAPQIASLATDIRQDLQRATAGASTSAAAQVPHFRTDMPRTLLRVLAGVTPLPLKGIYDTLMPLFVLITLAVLTVVFVLQQYGGSGTAETFGAGGLADYAGLFLAGVASEAIVNGLRTVKLKTG
ncbi:hypothetical protein D8770_27185 [Methylobacterium sp. DB1607]|nr:hypothetical protein [Methylobacterium sp. DB1607]